MPQVIQPMFFKVIKEILPGFIQGHTKDSHKAILKKYISTNMTCISKDGSAF